MDKEKVLFESMNDWKKRVNAKHRFDKFLDAVDSEAGLMEECLKIYKMIDDIVLNKENGQFVKVLPKGSYYYRARIIDEKDYANAQSGLCVDHGKLVGYNEFYSREPIIGISGNGRNNIAGSSYLYLASTPETACMEIKSQFADLISLARFELLKDVEIIDFSTGFLENSIYDMSLNEFFTQLMLQYCRPIRNINEYRATQIISDYLRKTGVDGIAYKSFFVPEGINYTLFNCHSSIIRFVDSRVLVHRHAIHSFWDFNEERALLTNEQRNLDYDVEIANQYLEQIKSEFTQSNQK